MAQFVAETPESPTAVGFFIRRAALAILGLVLVSVGLVTSSASASPSNAISFSGPGVSGSNGSYSVSVPYNTLGTYAATAQDSTSGTTLTYSANTGTAGCTVDTTSGVVTYTQAGACVITATASSADKDQGQGGGDGNASGSSATLALTVTPDTQTIAFTSTPPTAPLVGSSYLVTASASSGLPVTLSVDSASTSGCSITATGEVILSAPAGMCVIDANQLGTTDVAPAPQVQQTVTSSLATQMITVSGANPADVIYGSSTTFQIDASDSSGSPLSYSTASSTCTVNDTGLIGVEAVGTCTVVITAPATSTFSSASPFTFTLNVESAPVVAPPPAVAPPPVVTPPVVTPPVVTPVLGPPPIVISVSPPKPKPKPTPKLPKPKTVVIKPFREASHTLTRPLLAQVWRLALTIRHEHFTKVTLTGYTDNVFTPAMDAQIILERSLAVSHRLSYDLARLKVRGVTIVINPGATIQLVTLNTTPSNRALNRRVVAVLSAR